MYAFAASHGGITYAVALWNNPSARCLPRNWLELRRMACNVTAPANTPSAFLAWMTRYFRTQAKYDRLISYQDTAVHRGTIYKAAGWTPTLLSKARVRNRTANRVGTNRAYRSNMNGVAVDASAKQRWEKIISKSE